MVWVGFDEGGGRLRPGFAAPFELPSAEEAIRLLQVVDFLPAGGAPEIAVAPAAAVVVGLHALADQIVLPQGPGVGAHVQRGEVGDDRVAHAVVVEIYLRTLLDFVAQVAAEGTEAKHHHGLFQQVDVAPHGMRVGADGLPKLVEGDLAAHLQGQRPQQVLQQLGAAHFLIVEDVLVEVAGTQFNQPGASVIGMGDDLRVAAVQQPRLKQAPFRRQAVVGDHFGKGQREQPVFILAAGERFADFIGQLQRGGAADDELHVRQIIRDELQRQPDVPDPLRLIDHHEAMAADHLPQLRGGGVHKLSADVRLIAVQEQ